FEVTTKFRVPATAMSGPGQIAGKLRYQACNDKVCLPPKTIDVKVPVVVH
ncbi:MAG: protein-disulfide reductase DsbD domain-containing protein, partial [Bryobacteraceae bacterium]